jgi:hypothetical protein
MGITAWIVPGLVAGLLAPDHQPGSGPEPLQPRPIPAAVRLGAPVSSRGQARA